MNLRKMYFVFITESNTVKYTLDRRHIICVLGSVFVDVHYKLTYKNIILYCSFKTVYIIKCNVRSEFATCQK